MKRVPNNPAHQPAGSNRLFTRNFVLVCFSAFTHFMSFQLMLAALPLYIIYNLNGQETDVGLLMGAAAITALATRPVSGWAVETLGRKPVMLYGAVAFTAATVTYAVANSVPVIFLGRLLHGTGIGTSNTASAVYVADQTPAARRGEAMGFYGMPQSLAQAIGPAAGLAVMEAFGFPTPFNLCIALSVVSLVLAGLLGERFVPKEGLRLAWRMFISPRALLPTILVVGLAFATGSVTSFLPLYGRSQGVSNPGFFFTVYAIAMFLSRPLSGSLSDRWGRMTVILPGMGVIAMGLVVLAFSGQLWALIVSAILLGLGVGSVQPSLMALMIDLSGMEERGGAMSTYGIGMDVGIAIGSVTQGMVIQSYGFQPTFWLAAAAPLLMLGVYRVAAMAVQRR